MSSQDNNPKPGEIWRHSGNGKDYTILSVSGRSVHTDPPEIMVTYQAEYKDDTYGDKAVWFRLLSNWNEIVKVRGQTKPRFIKFSDSKVSQDSSQKLSIET